MHLLNVENMTCSFQYYVCYMCILYQKKKKIKPGYKKKIQWKVDEKRKRERRAANRAKGRAERKAKKQSF